MKHRCRLLLILLLLLLLGGLLLVPSVRWPIYGWLRGEAFYQGMPTSWWAEEIEASYQPTYPKDTFTSTGPTWQIDTRPSLWDNVWQRIVFRTTAVPVSNTTFFGPLLKGDPDALTVLVGLVRNESAKVRRVAIAGLSYQDQDEPKIEALLREAGNDPDELVRREAGNALLHHNFTVILKLGGK